MKSELLFIPMPAAGHLTSAVQFAKLLVSCYNDLSIRILMFGDGGSENSPVHSLYGEITKGIQFTELPTPPSQADFSVNSKNPFIFMPKLMESYKPQVRDLVTNLQESGSLKPVGFVVDMFTTEMIDVADEFELPAYLFYTSGAATLRLWFQMESLKDEQENFERDSDKKFWNSTYNHPVSAKQFPPAMFDKESFQVCLKIGARMIQTDGIIVNTSLDLESHALKALTGDQWTPPIYTVGPLINFAGVNTNGLETETIMKWLDDQPNSSVVFLCFGSLGSFEVDQAAEMANALENSGCRFLWSLRTAWKHNPGESETSLEEFLQGGFLQRTSRVGKVIGWAPQVQVLGHPAVGGFVSHCGWNSTLESVWFGVPMVAWPMYAEQQLNALQIVKDLGIALEIKKDDKALVRADEIEKGIRELMQPESEMKKKVKELMGKARSAVSKGGSSYSSMGRFMEDLLLAVD